MKPLSVHHIEFTRPQKHSLTLQGHRTSVTLEPAFWAAFVSIAKHQNTAVSTLAAQIDEARKIDASLASAIRVFVLKWYQTHAV